MTTSRPSSTTSSPEAAAALPGEPRRRGLLDGTWTTWRLGRWSLLRGRRGVILLLLTVLPAVPVIVTWARQGPPMAGALGFAEAVSHSYFGLVNLLVCLFLGCAALGEDREGGTLPYLLTRAVPRSALLLGRYLSYLLNTTALLSVGVVLCYVLTVGQMGAEALRVDLPILGWTLVALALTVATYGAVFLCLSVFVKRPLMVGLVLVFLWEAWAANAPPQISQYTVLHYAYVLLYQWTDLEVFRGLSGWAEDEAFRLGVGQAARTLLSIVGVTLVLALLRFRRKEFL